MEEKDALARVGRNLANFQTLERLLKELVPTLQMQGTVAEMAKSLKDGKKKVRKASLGNLSDAFHSSVLGPPAAHETPDVVTEPVFSFSMRIEASPERTRTMKGRWRKLVAQRNRLVHSQLMEYDLSRPEDCQLLSDLLDVQNGEICSMLDELALLRSHRASAAAVLVEQLQSGRLLRESPADDA